jgi:hypothetical protein
MKIRISSTIANEWDTRAITDVVPGLADLNGYQGTHDMSPDLAREVLADCIFNGDSKSGPEEMPAGARRAYRALADQIRQALKT